jgi:hypothetical protein
MRPDPTRRDLLRAGAAAAAIVPLTAAGPLTAAAAAEPKPKRDPVTAELMRRAAEVHADAQTWKAPDA